MSHGASDYLRIPRRQWWFLVLFGVLTVVAGAVGVLRYELEHGHHGEVHFLGALYHGIQMLILHTAHFEHGANAWLEVGRWAGVATAFCAGAILIGRRLKREWRRLLLKRWEDHYVVCGLGQKGFAIAMDLMDGGKVRGGKRIVEAASRFVKRLDGERVPPPKRVVIIDPNPEASFTDACEAAGACVILGDASKPEVLAEARITKAEEIIVITPSDPTNVRIAAGIREACLNAGISGRRPRRHVHLSDIHLREAVDRWIDQERNDAASRLHFFDVYDSEARRVLRDHPLDGKGIGPLDPRSVHVVILGFGRMGRSLALRAAKMGQFANGKPLRISVIDRHAGTQRDRLLFRYPILAGRDICDIQFHAVEAESQQARKLIEGWAAEPAALLHIYFGLDDDGRSLEVALRLQDVLRECKSCGIHVRIRSKDSVARILEAAEGDKVRIVPFGTVDDTCSDGAFRGDELDELARAIHRRFVGRRAATSQRTPENDPTLRDWDDLRDDIRESNRQQADHLRVKLRAIGCELVADDHAGEAIEALDENDIKALAPVEHQRWNAERWLAGWRHGKTQDKANRTSPYLVPWDKLDPAIQKYDFEAIEQIPELVKSAMPGKKIVRLSPARE